jgi:amino acid transporter
MANQPTAAKPAAFQQRLGLFDATMLVAGSMIGSGIFIVSADISRDVGSSGWLLGIWILTGVITIMGALSYAELAAMMPHAGGQYVYLREAYGPLWGFLYGWTCFLVIQTGFIAAVSVAFAKFLGVLVPGLGTDNELWSVKLDIELVLPVPWIEDEYDWPTFFKRRNFAISAGQIVAVGVTVVLTVINSFGVQAGKVVQNIFTVAKLLSLVVLIVLGLTIALNPETLRGNFSYPWDGIWTTKQFGDVSKIVPVAGLAAAMVLGGAMVGALFSADAWNNVTFTAGETKDPKRNLPRSLALGTVIVIGLYVLANLAYLAALPIKGDEIHGLGHDAEALAAESEAATAEAKIKNWQATIAEAKMMTLLGKEKATYWAKEGKQATVQLFEAENEHYAQTIKEAEAKIAEERKQQAAARQRAQQANAEATFARGIDKAKDDRVGTAVLERASPNFGVPFMAIAIMVSTFGCVNGLVLMGPRLYYAMSRDRLFFESVGRLNARGVPAAGLALQCLWSVVLIFSGTYSDLLDYIIFAALLFYVLTVSGLFVLRSTRPNAERPYRALGYPVVPALYVTLCALIMVDLLIVKPVYSWPSFLIVLAGIPVYYLWRGSAPGQTLADSPRS